MSVAALSFCSRVILGLGFLGCLGVGFAAEATPSQSPIFLLSDYGNASSSVAVCKAAIYAENPQANIIDISHTIPPFSKTAAARLLSETAPNAPTGSIFVVIVAPGTDKDQKPIVAKAKNGQYFVLPNNGIITPISERDGLVEAREITNKEWVNPNPKRMTAFGRDIFCPVAGKIAAGKTWTTVGPVAANTETIASLKPKSTPTGLQGVGISVDLTFGNVVTNIDEELFEQLGYKIGDTVSVKVGNQEIKAPFVSNFNQAAKKKPVLFLNPNGQVALGINQGNFAHKFLVSSATVIELEKRP